MRNWEKALSVLEALRERDGSRHCLSRGVSDRRRAMLSPTANDLVLIVLGDVLLRTLADRHSGGEHRQYKAAPSHFLT